MNSKNKPKVLYRDDGMKFVYSETTKRYHIQNGFEVTGEGYSYKSLNNEFFSPTLEEAQEKARHRKIGFRWVYKFKYPDNRVSILEKYNEKKQIWEEIPAINRKPK